MIRKVDQNQIIDKAAKILDVINDHLDEQPECRHSLKQILSSAFENENDSHWVTAPMTQNQIHQTANPGNGIAQNDCG